MKIFDAFDDVSSFTGMYTGSSYLDAELSNYGFLGEGVVNSSVLTIKTHYPYITDKEIFKPSHAILLIRKPIDAFIAEYYRALTGIHTGIVKLTNNIIDRKPWNTYVHTNLTGWFMLHKYWLGRGSMKFHILHYEELLNNLKYELKRVLEFLQIKVSDSAIKCVLQNADGIFHRKTLKRYNRQLLLELLDKTTKHRLQSIYENIVKIAHSKAMNTIKR